MLGRTTIVQSAFLNFEQEVLLHPPASVTFAPYLFQPYFGHVSKKDDRKRLFETKHAAL